MIPAAGSTFDRYAGEYDRWFDENPEIYKAQLAGIRSFLPGGGPGLEIGCGSGRFASLLGLGHGIDPSPALLGIARARGIETIRGAGECLPYRDGTFMVVVMMTVICFMDRPAEGFGEAFRVLRPGGRLVVGFIDQNSGIARRERDGEPPGKFLRYARFLSADDVRSALTEAGFAPLAAIEKISEITITAAEKKKRR